MLKPSNESIQEDAYLVEQVRRGGLNKAQDKETNKVKGELEVLASKVNNINMIQNILNWRITRLAFFGR
jgi:hypothetical protein